MQTKSIYNINEIKIKHSSPETGEKEQNKSLEDNNMEHILAENQRLKELLQDAKVKLLENDKMKSSFMANISHEVRTPLNGIIGFANLLTGNNLTIKQKNMYSTMLQECSVELMKIVDNIFDVSKLELQLLELNNYSFSLKRLMEELYEEYHIKLSKIDNKENVSLSLDHAVPNIFINTDRVRLKQVFASLLDNAMKYTNEGKIKIGAVKKNDYVQFFVEDTGTGIPADKEKYLFDRFYKLDNPGNPENSGVGLGLPLADNLLKLMGGDIWFESSIDVGTTFYFTIPYEELTEEIVEQKMTDCFVNSNCKILIVEDDKCSQIYLEEILESEFLEYDCTHSGFKALNMVEKNHYEILLIDVKLPDISGIEVIKKIRENNPDVFIITQTASPLLAIKDKCYEAGCNSYITKPINKNELFKIIYSHLKKKTGTYSSY